MESLTGGDTQQIMAKPSSTSASNHNVKLICSYGGKIQPTPTGNKLVYSGGDNKILIVDRNIKFHDFVTKLGFVCRIGKGSVSLKYQLPGEDLNVLISLTNDDDLENMMFEYDRLHRVFSSVKTVRIRLFLNVDKPAVGLVDSGSGSSSLNPDYLFGFDKELDYSNFCDDHELEHWKIPRAVDPQQFKKPGLVLDEQIGSYNGNPDDVGLQSQKRDTHVITSNGVATPRVFYWLPGSLGFQTSRQMGLGHNANGGGCWEEPPVYIFVPSTSEQTTVSRY